MKFLVGLVYDFTDFFDSTDISTHCGSIHTLGDAERMSMTSLRDLQDTLDHFHHHHKYFQECGVHPDGFNLPQQHSLVHYIRQICAFGAPNGICSSITKSKYIQAVKEPWWRSSRFEAMEQMLLTNQRLNKLTAARVDFADCAMLQSTFLSWILIQLGMSSHASIFSL